MREPRLNPGPDLVKLVAEMGVPQIVYGTDNPFNWPVTVDLVLNASYLNNSEKEAILSGTLTNMLRITS